MKLTTEQEALQSLFKEFLGRLINDAAKFTNGPIRIKTDLSIGVGEDRQKEKAIEYAAIMKEIISAMEVEQQGKNVPGPTGILAQ